MHFFPISYADFSAYFPSLSLPGWKSFQDSRGWTDYWLGDHLVYSHRKNYHTHSSYSEHLHQQTHYELSFAAQGDVAFIIDNYCFRRQPGMLMLFKPNCIHTTRLLSESEYERYVFLFDEEAFHLFGANINPGFLHQDAGCIMLPARHLDTLYEYLGKIDSIFSHPAPDTPLLAYSYIIQLFCFLSRYATASEHIQQNIPENILKIKQYIDESYLSLNTTSEIAEHFFYRREYVSRLFKEYFNTNLSDYLTTLKIHHSKTLLEAGVSVTAACYQSGFRNMSTFTTAFRQLVHMNPSSYKKELAQRPTPKNASHSFLTT